MILPPLVVAVLNQASTLNTCGPAASPFEVAGTAAEPVNVVAGFGSVSGPAVPRVALGSTVRSAPPTQS